MTIFDEEAEHYDKWYETKMGAHADKVETECAFRLFKVEPGMRILDVGCGTGNFSLKLAQKGALVTGVDSSREMLEVARKKAKKKKLDIIYKEMDAQKLGFSDDNFDAVLSMAALEFVSDYPEMISEMFRVCKKGGSILVGTINRDSAWGKLYQQAGSQEPTSVFRHAHLRTPAELRKVNSEALVEIKECLFIPPDLSEADINLAQEEKYSRYTSGGFFCALWKKL